MLLMTPLQFDLSRLSTLTMEVYDDPQGFLPHRLPSLKHLEGVPMGLRSLEIRSLETLTFTVESESWGELRG